MKIQFIVKYSKKSTYINSIIDDLINNLIDTSLLFDVEIDFHLLKDESYNEKSIYITPSFYSKDSEEIPQNYLDFHSYYLENYVHHENINIDLISVNQH